MADSDLSTSISALKTKIVNGIPTANVNELVSLARAVKALNLGEDKSLEDAINARANALVGSASADDVARLAGAIKQVLNPASITVTTLSTITGDLIPDQNIVHDLGSSTNRFKDLYLSGNTAVIGDSKISDDGTGIDIRDTSGNPRTIKAKEVTIDDGTGNPIKMKRGAGNTIQFLDSSDNSIETQEQASAPAMGAYNLLSQLPTSGVNTGTQAYVAENNKLYLFNGTGWYNIALISNPITAVTGNAATYELDNQGSPTTITLSSSDPDGIPLQWSHQVTSGSLGGTTITNVNNVFTITPSTNNSDSGNFTVSFIATNGENQETSSSTFSLEFGAPAGGIQWRGNSTYTWIVPAGVTKINVVAIGGGGAGTNHQTWSDRAGTGGGGGGLAYINDVTVTPGEVYEIKVGNRGGYISTNTIGSTSGSGQQSYVRRQSDNKYLVTANGGGGGMHVRRNYNTSNGRTYWYNNGNFQINNWVGGPGGTASSNTSGWPGSTGAAYTGGNSISMSSSSAQVSSTGGYVNFYGNKGGSAATLTGNGAQGGNAVSGTPSDGNGTNNGNSGNNYGAGGAGSYHGSHNAGGSHFQGTSGTVRIIWEGPGNDDREFPSTNIGSIGSETIN